MEIIKIHYKLSRPVVSYSEIKDEAEKLIDFTDNGKFKGNWERAFAIAHSQVSETPYAFFVVHKDCVKEKLFPHQVIINPVILEEPLEITLTVREDGKELKMPNRVMYQEACMSFPFRQPKKIIRPNKIRIQYQVPALFGLRLKTIQEWCDGVKSEIFQHDTEHTRGKNIYFESEKPVAWWKLIGNEKSKGGTSLDAPEELGLNRSKEKARE